MTTSYSHGKLVLIFFSSRSQTLVVPESMLSLRCQLCSERVHLSVHLEGRKDVHTVDQAPVLLAVAGLQALEHELDRLHDELEEVRREAQLRAAQLQFEHYTEAASP